MKQEFEYEFKGFRGRRSKCVIRMIHLPNNVFLVVCSQTEEIVGTSICNAFELICEGLEQRLKTEHRWQMIDEFKDIYDTHKRLPVAAVSFVLHLISNRLKNNRSWFQRFKSAKRLYWIEHWPSNLVHKDEDEYWRVRWDGENSPEWELIEDLGGFEEQIGLPLKSLQFSNSNMPQELAN